MRAPFFALAALFAGLPFGTASGNDSTAELTTGGLVLDKTPAIEMRAEDLFISEKEIRVRYRFFNSSANDVTTVVAFPMPDIVWDAHVNIAVPSQDPLNFLDFHTIADGLAVVADVEQKVLVGGVDETARFRSLGLPLAPQFEATWKALDALAPDMQRELLESGAVQSGDYDVGKGMEHHLQPAWTLRTNYYWRQTFPAGREIVIEHHYLPSVGETVGTMLGSPDIEAESLQHYKDAYCADADFLASTRRAMSKPDKYGSVASLFYERRIAYILSTGANWAGPIGDFHLTIDKGAPDSLVSFCSDGVKKVGPTRFEVRHINFTPAHELQVLILYRPRR
jgi:Domain of unknown function (DUF4424)